MSSDKANSKGKQDSKEPVSPSLKMFGAEKSDSFNKEKEFNLQELTQKKRKKSKVGRKVFVEEKEKESKDEEIIGDFEMFLKKGRGVIQEFINEKKKIMFNNEKMIIYFEC